MGTIGTVPSNAHSWHPVRNLKGHGNEGGFAGVFAEIGSS